MILSNDIIGNELFENKQMNSKSIDINNSFEFVEKGLKEKMIEVISSAIDSAWLRIRHPSIKVKGFNHIRIGAEIRLQNKADVTFGRGIRAARTVTLSCVGGKLSIGDNVSFNRNCIVVCRAAISIGKRCMFGPNLVIYDHDHKYDSKRIMSNEYNCSPIIIGENCWIGANVTILRGTQIGEGSIIGAGTVLKGIVPPHSIVINKNVINIQPMMEGLTNEN